VLSCLGGGWERLARVEVVRESDSGVLMKRLRELKPTVLHFACHGTTTELLLQRSFPSNESLVRGIAAHNENLGERRVRLVVVNACKSGALARLLQDLIDFVIGHGDEDLDEESALRFSRELYARLSSGGANSPEGMGTSLFHSFAPAKTAAASGAYELLAPRYDPKHFCFRVSQSRLPVSSVSSTSTSRPCTFCVEEEDLRAYQTRQAEMDVLTEWADKARANGPRRMLVHGLGGAGKTTLARVFAANAEVVGLAEAVLFLSLPKGNCLNCYAKLVDLLAEDGGKSADIQILSGTSNISTGQIDHEKSSKASYEKSLRAKVHNLLSGKRWKGKWLAVLDDLPDPRDAKWVVEEFPFGSGITMVTSRSDAWARESGAGKWVRHTLGSMTEEEACAWVERRLPGWSKSESGVRRLVQRLGCLPLTVEAAAAFADAHSIRTAAEFLRILESQE